MRTFGFVLFSFLALGAGQTFAQEEIACETCGVHPITAPVQNVYQPGWVIQVNGQYSSLGTGLDGDQTLANRELQRLNSTISQLSAAYNFSQEFGLQLSVPYIHRNYRRTAGSQMESGTLAGLGDITLAGRFTPMARTSQDSNFFWNFQLGLKMPTGSASALQEEVGHLAEAPAGGHAESEEHAHKQEVPGVQYHAGHHHDDEPEQPGLSFNPAQLSESLIGGHDLALGSGSFDAVLGTSLFWQEKSFFVNAGAQYLLRSRGSYDYQFGNALLWNFSPGVLVARDESQLIGLQLNLSGELKDQDNISGLRIGHTGVRSVFAGPQIFVSTPEMNIQGGLDLPIVQHTDGATLVPDYRLRLQMNWRL